MITRLFSTFDPSSTIFKTTWLIGFLILILFTHKTQKNSQSFRKAVLIISSKLNEDLKSSRKNQNKSLNWTIVSTALIITVVNLSSIYPQNFTLSSQISVIFPLSLSIWLRINMIGLFKKPAIILRHMVPQRTPIPLINFIVIIELTRNLIRPITLSVRLMANIVAGHLLIILLRNLILYIKIWGATLIPVVITLVLLELSVSFIQRYVFVTLVKLYTNEIS